MKEIFSVPDLMNRRDYGDSLLILATLVALSRKPTLLQVAVVHENKQNVMNKEMLNG